MTRSPHLHVEIVDLHVDVRDLDDVRILLPLAPGNFSRPRLSTPLRAQKRRARRR